MKVIMDSDLELEEDSWLVEGCGLEEVIKFLESLKGIKIRGGNDISMFSIYNESHMGRLRSDEDRSNVIDAVNRVKEFLECSVEEVDSKKEFSYQKGCEKLTQRGFETSYDNQDGNSVGSIQIEDLCLDLS